MGQLMPVRGGWRTGSCASIAVILGTSQATSEFAPGAAFHDCDQVRVGRPRSRKIRRRAQSRLARQMVSEKAPTNKRLIAQVVSRSNQLRDRNLRPK